MRTPSANAKSEITLKAVIAVTQKLWRAHHLTYDQARDVATEGRRALALDRPKQRQRVVAQLSGDEETRLIGHAYRMRGERGLLIKMLFQTGARVAQFVPIKPEDVFFDEHMVLMRYGNDSPENGPLVPLAKNLVQLQHSHC
jgi:integrase/recombinase XerD